MTEPEADGAAAVPSIARLSRECWLVAGAASLLSVLSLYYCARHHLLLLYGDAVAHLHIARRVVDSLNPGFHQLGSVWLPLPHLLLLPFVLRMEWWQNAVPAAVPSMIFYVAGCVGIYRLAHLWLSAGAASVAAAAYGLNPGLLYMQTTAMTEPLFLAEMIWAALLVAEFGLALDAGNRRRAGRTMIAAGFVFVAAVYTRYDGWIYASMAWLIVAFGIFGSRVSETHVSDARPGAPAHVRGAEMHSSRPHVPVVGAGTRRGSSGLYRSLREPLGGLFLLFTVMLAIAPTLWVAYNARQFGDPLDFLRGPYSAKAIEARTATPGAPHYPGWHSISVAALYFMKAAEAGAVPVAEGNKLLWLAVFGGAYGALRYRAFGRRGAIASGTAARAALLLWMPLPFYAYSIAYGSVPIFIPLWWPHSWYNTRYGMEMLPAFALAMGFLAAMLTGVVEFFKPAWVRSVVPLWLAVIVVNALIVARATPLVLREAYANSESRIPFERALAESLLATPHHDQLLMYTSAHIGALQQAGIALKGTINEGDYYQWKTALADPARARPVVVAIDGDPVADAVAAHPQELRLVRTICSTEQPCARIYVSLLGQ